MTGRRLDFEIHAALETSLVTARAGVPSLIEVFRQTGTAAKIDEGVRIKTRNRGLSAARMVESLFALWASGGERCEDLDRGAATRPWRRFSATSFRRRRRRGIFLAAFHEDDFPLLHDGKSTVPSTFA